MIVFYFSFIIYMSQTLRQYLNFLSVAYIAVVYCILHKYSDIRIGYALSPDYTNFFLKYKFIQSEIAHYVKYPNILTLLELKKRLNKLKPENCTKCSTLQRGKRATSTPQDVILGMAIGYHQVNLLSFVRTLRTVECKARLVIIVDDEMLNTTLNKQEVQEMTNCGTVFLNVGKVYKYRNASKEVARIIIYLALLQNIWEEFDRVIITDLYDTYFQADPFTLDFHNYEIFATRENSKILDRSPNYEWILRTDPNYSYQKYKDQWTINGGLWYGGTLPMVEFLNAFVDYDVWFNYSKFLNDQSILNMMYRDGKLPKSFFIDEDGYMVSATFWEFKSKPNKYGMLKTGRVYPVTVHQYNRIMPLYSQLVEMCPRIDDWDSSPYATTNIITQYY